MMYIDRFLLGVIATLVAELLCVILFVIRFKRHNKYVGSVELSDDEAKAIFETIKKLKEAEDEYKDN